MSRTADAAAFEPFDPPPIGLGTFGKQGDIGLEAMLDALELGYRHIDTAQGYSNESNVGLAIERSGLARDAIHVTTKVAAHNLSAERVRPSVEESLRRLRSPCADLVLIHWPSKGDAVPLEETLDALLRCKADGLVRHVGVSNFTRSLLDRAVAATGPGVVRANQVEMHPFLQNRLVRARCAELGIAVTAYMPVAGGAVADDPAIAAIAERHGASPAQVAIAWLLHAGAAAIPSSRSRRHLADNLRAAEIRLSAEDLQAIDALDRNFRIIDPPAVAPDWD